MEQPPPTAVGGARRRQDNALVGFNDEHEDEELMLGEDIQAVITNERVA